MISELADLYCTIILRAVAVVCLGAALALLVGVGLTAAVMYGVKRWRQAPTAQRKQTDYDEAA